MKFFDSASVCGPILGALLMTLGPATGEAATWHVKADQSRSGNGTRNAPLSSLQEVEAAIGSGRHDLRPPLSTRAGRGIQLKDGQQLIGLGTPVNTPAISTTSGGAPATDIFFTPGGVVFAGVTDFLTVDPQP
jgi:hypothetical protein